MAEVTKSTSSQQQQLLLKQLTCLTGSRRNSHCNREVATTTSPSTYQEDRLQGFSTLTFCISMPGLMRFLTGTCIKTSTAHLTSISIGHVDSVGVCRELYAGIAFYCPKLQELSLNLEGPSTELYFTCA
ncbi:hypothetical protein ABBQ32_005395 [Trebouxia sp. C0010 RCD-2024]